MIEIPFHTVSTMNSREHWSVRAKRAGRHRGGTHTALQALQSKPQLPCTVKITRIAPRSLDSDNLVASAKNVRDGVADWLGIDDRSTLVDWKYAQTKGKPKYYAVRIEFET